MARQSAESAGRSLFVRLLARLEADIFPQIGSRPIMDIDAPELLEMLSGTLRNGAP